MAEQQIAKTTQIQTRLCLRQTNNNRTNRRGEVRGRQHILTRQAAERVGCGFRAQGIQPYGPWQGGGLVAGLCWEQGTLCVVCVANSLHEALQLHHRLFHTQNDTWALRESSQRIRSKDTQVLYSSPLGNDKGQNLLYTRAHCCGYTRNDTTIEPRMTHRTLGNLL